MDTCKPLFDLVSGAHEDEDAEVKNFAVKPADLMMSVAKLIVAAGFKMKEQARQEMAEEDLGGGMFDEYVKDMREGAARCSPPQQYTVEERETLDKQRATFNAPEKEPKKYKTGTKLYQAQLSDDGHGAIVHVQAEVRAPPEQLVAWFMGNGKHFSTKAGVSSSKVRDISYKEPDSDHSVTGRALYPLPAPFSDREFVLRTLWEKLDDDTFFVTQASVENAAFPRREGVVRVTYARAFVLTKISTKLTKFEMKASVSFGGAVPRSISNTVSRPAAASTIKSPIMYFCAVRPSDSFDDGDATVLGRILFLNAFPLREHEDTLRQEIDAHIRMINVLRSAQAKYRFLDEFLFNVIRNKIKIGANQTSFSVDTPLVALTANEAGRIGRSLVNILMANATGEAAVDELIGNYMALGELESEYSWFRPMMEAIAMELMSEVAYSVKVRAGIGAAVSMADTASDAFMINDFFNTDRAGTAKTLVGMVGANLLAQLLLVFVQTNGLKKNKWKKIFFEILSVVTFSKPGVDAYRVAAGLDKVPGAPLDPLTEMTGTKMAELVCESLPGLVLQLVAFLRAGDKGDVSAIVSLLISTASTALTATTLFYDNETDPSLKKKFPELVGLVPDGGRTRAFATVFLLCAIQIVVKAFAVALLAVTNSTWLFVYMAADHIAHLVYRIARRDFVHKTPMPVAAAYVYPLIILPAFKVIGDFTGSMNVRLPFLLGGSYFFANLMVSHASVFVAVHLYSEYAEGGEDLIPAWYLWRGAALLTAVWFATFAFFATRVAVPKFRHTLWSTATGRRVVLELFLEGQSEDRKFAIFRTQRLLWEGDIGADVKAWSTENWERWEEEKPGFFTDVYKAAVPDEYIPAQFLAGMGGVNRERRGSAVVSVRESLRRRSFAEEA
ncbi:hypothetical protein TeGR_g14147 [Tetraparma gracilis]|uniref:Uncharacterized protein n=1 Tax=Tetraparma gracilis TaxID=2962635 RepID=A0ABQ6N6V4_9STRA|nr:hypothetical protein TeGR_g14147 [Tetraparma gracilis]